MAPLVRVYNGRGVGSWSASSVIHSLRKLLKASVEVRCLRAVATASAVKVPNDRPFNAVTEIREADVISGSWRSTTLMLVMPGGADIPYCQALNGQGNAHIKDYVRAGGVYLGLCAGAYYACSHVCFEAGTELEVIGNRELAFFPGSAWGSVAPGFEYQSERGAQAVSLQYVPVHLSVDAGSASAPNGVSACDGRNNSLARFSAVSPDDMRDPGELSQAGRGEELRIREHNGPHGESATPGLDTHSGARAGVFTLTDTHSRVTTAEASETAPGELGGGGGATMTGPPQDGERQEIHHLRTVRDYVNGGPCFLVHPGVRDEDARGLEVLARYCASGRIAAVKCTHGAGVAVLCGSHPEFHPDLLISQLPGSSRPGEDVAAADEYSARLRCLIEALRANEHERQDFLRALLLHAGLAEHLQLADASPFVKNPH